MTGEVNEFMKKQNLTFLQKNLLDYLASLHMEIRRQISTFDKLYLRVEVMLKMIMAWTELLIYHLVPAAPV